MSARPSHRLFSAFHAAPRPADALVPLLPLAAWVAFFGTGMSTQAMGERSWPAAWVAALAMVLSTSGVALLALPWATFRPAARRGAIAWIALFVIGGPALSAVGHRLLLADEQRLDVRERERLADFGIHEPVTPMRRHVARSTMESWRLLRAGRHPSGRSAADPELQFARRRIAGTLAAPLVVVALFLPSWPRRRLRWPWWVAAPLALGLVWLPGQLWHWLWPVRDEPALHWPALVRPALFASFGVLAYLATRRWGREGLPPPRPWSRRGRWGWSVAFALTIAGSVLGALRLGSARGEQPPPRFAHLERLDEPAPALSEMRYLAASAAATAPSIDEGLTLVEFWGTWCGPCVRAMPKVQELHEVYGPLGLTVLAVSYEVPEDMRGFLEEGGYTMLVGSDPERRTVGAYGVKSWPTSVLVSDGRIVHRGAPTTVERLIVEELGLAASPAEILGEWAAATDDEERRRALRRLVGVASCATAVEPIVSSLGEHAPEPVARAHARGETAFDVRAWARERLAELTPLDEAEVRRLLARRERRALLDRLVHEPESPGAPTAVDDAGYRDWCAGAVEEWRREASRALTADRWLWGGAWPEDQSKMWEQLVATSMLMSIDRSRILAVDTGSGYLLRANAGCLAREHALRAAACRWIAEGRTPTRALLETEAQAVQDELLAELRQAIDGGPEPVADGS